MNYLTIGELRLHGCQPVPVFPDDMGNPDLKRAARKAGVAGATGHISGFAPAGIEPVQITGRYFRGSRPVLATGNYYPDNY